MTRKNTTGNRKRPHPFTPILPVSLPFSILTSLSVSLSVCLSLFVLFLWVTCQLSHMNLSWPLANITHLSIMPHKYTHTHTWHHSSKSHSFSLYFSLDLTESDQREALMLCYGDRVSGCPFQHVTYTQRGKGRGNRGGGVWVERQ